MGRFRIDLAEPSLDESLRRVVATPMPGRISLSFRREPSYFNSTCVSGVNCQTIVGVDQDSDQVIGMASRSVSNVYVAGQTTRVGYLSGLRILPHVRSLGLLARGFRYLRQLHDDDPNPPTFYLTTIAEGNDSAIRILTSGRAGLPTYHYLGNYCTLAIGRQRRPSAHVTCCVGPMADQDLAEVISFLNSEGSMHDFFPVYCHGDFTGRQPKFRDLAAEQILVIRRDRAIVGVVGIWNQSRFRQTVVERYRGFYGSGRSLYNAWARLTSKIELPPPGETLRQSFAAFPLVKNSDKQLFQSLLDHMVMETVDDRQHILLGLSSNSPMYPIAKRYSSHCFETRVYAVSWDPLPISIQAPMSHPFYLELGCL